MKKKNPLNLILVIIFGFIGGIIFISPLLPITNRECSRKNWLMCEIFYSLGFNYNQIWGGFLGILVVFVVIFFILNLKPETRKNLKEYHKSLWDGNNILSVNMKNYFTHYTQAPMMLGMLLFVIFILLLVTGLTDPILNRLSEKDKPSLLMIFLSPSFFLFGLSGFRMIKQKEAIDKSGQPYHGFWAIFNGILGLLFGWGFLLFITLAFIFDW